MATYAADAWTALGDPTRRHIVEQLAARPRSVTELAADLPISRPAVSQHLALLKRIGLVRDHARGTRRIYEVDVTRLEQFQRELDAFWATTLHNLAQAADARGPDPLPQEDT